MNNKNNEEKENGTKEDFCGACLAIPAAMAGAGVAGYGAKKKGQYKKTKNYTLYIGIGITIFFLIVGIIYARSCQSCK